MLAPQQTIVWVCANLRYEGATAKLDFLWVLNTLTNNIWGLIPKNSISVNKKNSEPEKTRCFYIHFIHKRRRCNTGFVKIDEGEGRGAGPAWGLFRHLEGVDISAKASSSNNPLMTNLPKLVGLVKVDVVAIFV